MMKHTMKTCCAALLLISLLCMLTPAALADGGPEPADAVSINTTDGTVTIISRHMAAEEISSIQLKLDVGQVRAGFAFDVGDTYMKEFRLEEKAEGNILSLYIAGSDPLLTGEQTRLVLGKLTDVTDLASVTLVPNSLEYVYGTRLVSQAITAPQLESSTGGTTMEGLRLLYNTALSIQGKDENEEDIYTADSWGALQQAIDYARSVLENLGEESDYNAAYNALQSAVTALKPVKLAELEAAVEKAKGMLNDEETTYDPADVEVLQDAIKAAEDAIDAVTADPTKAAVTNWGALLDAINNAMEMTPIVNGEGGGGTVEDPNGGDTGDTTATATPTATAVNKNIAPNTGDEQALLPLTALLVLSGALLVVIVRRRARCGR